MRKTILFSPVRQDPKTLELFLKGIRNLKTNDQFEVWFFDDNDNQKSKDLLVEFSKSCNVTRIISDLNLVKIPYIKDDNTHQWNNILVDKIITIKNYAISLFLKSDSENMFFLDSDLILDPGTLLHLQSLQIPVVSEIFWTKFSSSESYLPNVWDVQTYKHSSTNSILRLRNPGIYKVGGLGACLLIRREALERGLNYSRITNVDFWGEDRHFSVRAVCLGYELFVDTTFPAFHLYRPSLFSDCLMWMEQGYPRSFFDAWLDEKWEMAIRDRFVKKDPSYIDRIKMAANLLLGK